MIAEARSPPRPRAKTWDHLSHSAVQLYRTCPLKFFFRYVQGLPERLVSANSVFGGAIHHALEAHYRELLCGNPAPTLDELLAIFWDHWRSLGDIQVRFNRGEGIDEIGRLADRVLRAFRGSKLAHPDGTIIGVEESIRGVVVPGIPDFVARLDLVVETESALHVIDFKTARRAWCADHVADAAPQLHLYRELVKPLAGNLPIHLEFSVLTKAKVPTISLHTVEVEGDEVLRTKRIVQQVWRGIQAGVFYPNPSAMNCPTCPYRSQCRAWTG